MRIIIEGEIPKTNIIKIGKFLKKMYRKKKEHINVLIQGMENKSMIEISKILKEIFK